MGAPTPTPGRPRSGRKSSLAALGALLLPGCFLDLPPVLEDDGDSSAPPMTTEPIEPEPIEPEPMEPEPTPDEAPDAGDGGAVDAGVMDAAVDPEDAGPEAGVDSGTGGAGGAPSMEEAGVGGVGGAPPSCGAGFFDCDGECLEDETPCCPGGCEHDNATSECRAEGCVMLACEEGHADCDGADENGCEADFGLEEVPGSTLVAPRIDLASPGDPFAEIPLHPLATPCVNCMQADNRVPQPDQVNAGPVPPTEVLAGFALGWDENALYLRARVFDDDLSSPVEGLSARHYDNIEFLFDGDTAADNGPDDRLIYVGYDGNYAELDDKDESATTNFEVVRSGSCYTLTAEFSRRFLSQESDGLDLAAGSVFAFDVAVNDHDGPPNQDMVQPFEHAAHLFFRNPGPNYWYGMRDFARLELGQ